MAIWCFSKAIACGTTIVSAVLVYCIIISHNRREKKKTDKADKKIFEIKITNTSLPNVHNERQNFAKNSVNPNNTPLISKVRQVVSPLSNQSNTCNNPVKPLHSKRLYQIQSKTVEDCNSITQNNARFFTHNKSSETIILNNSALSFEHGFDNTQDNLNCSVVFHINNSIDSTISKVQIKVSNRLIKMSTLNKKSLYASDDSSTKNGSTDLIMISQKNKLKEINIMIPSFNQCLVEYLTFRGNRLTNAHNNKCTKEIERNNITIIINAST